MAHELTPCMPHKIPLELMVTAAREAGRHIVDDLSSAGQDALKIANLCAPISVEPVLLPDGREAYLVSTRDSLYAAIAMQRAGMTKAFAESTGRIDDYRRLESSLRERVHPISEVYLREPRHRRID